MADTFPSSLSQIYQDPKFIAEQKVFKALQENLPSEAKIYCQCPFFRKGFDGNKLDGECDMIVLLPNNGIIFLEIKGGLIGYKAKDRQWTSTRRDTNEIINIKNPVTQSRSAHYEIFELFMKETSVNKDQFINCVHVVCFPDTPRPEDPRPFGPDMPLDIFLFQGDLDNIHKNLVQTCRWFQGEKEIYRLGPPIIKAFDKILVGNDLPVKLTLRHQIDSESESMNFSPTQSVYLNVIEQLNYVALSGGAGTGKTLMAIELIRRLHLNKRILFLCFNRALARHVRFSLKSLSKDSDVTVSNSYYWVNQLSRELGLPRSEEEIENRLEAVIMKAQEELSKYDLIIIDEGQDFSDEWFIHIETMLKDKGRFYVFYDQRQSIFKKHSQYFLDEKFQKLSLNENFRNTKSIFSHFQNLSNQSNFISLGPQGVEPEFIIVKNYEQQFMWIADKIKQLISKEGLQLRETGVVLYDGLKETNIKNLSKVIPSITGHQHTNAEFVEPDQIMMDTVNRIKGLEVPVMFLTNLISPLEPERLYVSLSRAKNRLYVVGLESKVEELKNFIRTIPSN